ncbi:MAG: trypsin-like peptidase domain-containing protein [Paludibacter sp.]|nr:trypsin-like peptidase domain-containing protein [Paludibacter sp.]
MINKIVTPSAKLDLAKKTRNQLKWHNVVFIISLLVFPILSYFAFQLKWVNSKPEFSNDIEAPVAKLVVDGTVGTAFLVNSTTLLTARHMIMNKNIGDKVDLFFEKSKTQLQTTATIKFITKTNVQVQAQGVPFEYFLTDFALLSVPEITDIQPLNLGSSANAKNLDEVILVGYPQGDYSITKGNINSDKYQGFNLFKLDATANPGNSGGPCISKADNTVIGILVGGSGRFAQGENVAVKIDDVIKILKQAGIKF